ncbi:MAG TPA: threonine/serine dehydratase [Gemmatimonadaceae bacterium]|nr:threonine/serine dehydratase [Gemmatimonadaceae bacterium]
MLPSPSDVLAAGHRLRGITERTPLVRSAALSVRAGADVRLKCENLQRTGSFKLRGATNALAALTDGQRVRGVVASSAGNHGLGVAHAARALGVRARIFIPATAPDVKRRGIIALGAEVDDGYPDYDAAHQAAERFAADHGMTFVNPCAGAALLAGQGTVALEIIEELPTVRTFVVPVGGGGLVGGMAALIRAVLPAARIIGVQSEATNAMAASLAAGARVDVEVVPTLADGLAGQIDDEGFAIGRVAIDTMVTVRESEIAEAMRWLAHEHDLRVEGSGAVAAAALLHGQVAELTGAAVVVISGGNVDDARWRAIAAPPAS